MGSKLPTSHGVEERLGSQLLIEVLLRHIQVEPPGPFVNVSSSIVKNHADIFRGWSHVVVRCAMHGRKDGSIRTPGGASIVICTPALSLVYSTLPPAGLTMTNDEHSKEAISNQLHPPRQPDVANCAAFFFTRAGARR